MLNNKRRPDGRAFDQIREIWIEAGVLPRTHGSAPSSLAAKRRRWSPSRSAPRMTCSASSCFEGEANKRFMLHYNFPPFSVGEVGFMRGPGRREIGHGALGRARHLSRDSR